MTPAAFLSPDDPRWAAFLARVPHDVYARPEYVRCAAHHEGGTPLAFHAQHGAAAILVPLVRRPLPPTLGAPAEWGDAVSPYGYPGVLVDNPDAADDLAVCLAAFRETGAQHDLVTVFVRLHPLLAVAHTPLEAVGAVQHQGTVIPIDLTPAPETLWSQMRANHRTGIRRLERDGFVPAMDAWDYYEEFIHLYESTMQRVQATSYYFFENAYFDELRRAVAANLHLGTVSAPDGSLAAAGLFFLTDGILQYHLGATADAHLKRAPSKLMFNFVRDWGKQQGARVFNLGGGVGGTDDSLLHFKAGYSPLRAEFYTLRMVVDAERYARLAGSEAVHDLSGYFPAYRRAP